MSQKSKDKFEILWATYSEARSARRDADAAPWITVQDAWAAQVLTDEGIEAAALHLDALTKERRAYKRLLRHARRHGAGMLEGDPATEPAQSEPAAPNAPKIKAAKPLAT